MLDRTRSILDSAKTAGSVPERQIRYAEELLGVRFPQVFRAFLSEYGAALGPGWEIYGIDPNRVSEDSPPIFVDVVKTTKRNRSGPHGQNHPRHLLEIAHDGVELGFHLDLSAVSHGDCPVVALGPGVDLLRAANTFEEFLLGWSRDQLEGFPKSAL